MENLNFESCNTIGQCIPLNSFGVISMAPQHIFFSSAESLVCQFSQKQTKNTQKTHEIRH